MVWVSDLSLPSALRSHEPRAIAFDIEESARRPYGARNLLISKSEFGLHIVCDFGGRALVRPGFLDSNSHERNTPTPTWAVAYNGQSAMYERK